MRILHLEDNPQDAELVLELLLGEWPRCEIKVVDRRADFIDQLPRHHDVILADFTLPAFDGLSALKLARALTPDTPFIFVSGSIGEERAIEAVRTGAYDYVIKDHMMRLVTSIRRALSEHAESNQRRAAEKASKEAEMRNRELADFINKCREAITVSDLEGRFIFWNEGATVLTGWTDGEALGRTTPELLGPSAQIVEARSAVLQTGEWRGEVNLSTKSGQKRVVDQRITLVRDASGRPKAFLCISADVTEKKKLEEQFLRMQRIETIGTLAAGIAHDLNNVLYPIVMCIPELRRRTADPAGQKLLGALEKSAQRGSDLVQQIVAYARGASGEHHPIQLGTLAQDLVGFVEQTFPKTIAFESSLAPDLWVINANPSQMHQVLLNLCVNARDAMPQGGTLRLRAQNVSCEEGAVPLIGMRPGSYLLLEVGDTGTGMTPEVFKHIWEPFFTTKGTRDGSGLGLATVRGIVENHQGYIGVKTEVGHGSTFTLYLPACPSEAGRAPEPAALSLP